MKIREEVMERERNRGKARGMQRVKVKIRKGTYI